MTWVSCHIASCSTTCANQMFILLIAPNLGCMVATPSRMVYSRSHPHLGVLGHLVIVLLPIEHTHAEFYFLKKTTQSKTMPSAGT